MKIIRLSKSCIGPAEKSAVAKVLDEEFLGMGKSVQRFEEDLAGFFGHQVVCVSSGTAALHLALQACGVGPGDEVLVPSLTYVATFQAISATGAIPIACDICEKTWQMDSNDLAKRISDRTKAIIPVHYAGSFDDINSIYRIADIYQLRVIEDAAHAFGSRIDNIRVGSVGDIACFSFDGIKNITSGEGGCIVTSDNAVLNRVRNSRLLGVNNDTDRRYKGERSWLFDVDQQGWRYHMSNVMAAIGIEQLKRLEEFSDKRQKLAMHYDKLLSAFDDIFFLKKDYSQVVPHIYPIRIMGLKNKRPLLIEFFAQAGIQVGFHYNPNHTLSYYKNNHHYSSFEVTELVFPELLSLPMHPDLTFEDLDVVVNTLRQGLNHIFS